MQVKSFISNKQIKERIRELALEIKRDFKQDIHCVVVLSGAIVFFADLMKALKKEGLNIEFSLVKLSSYAGKESRGKISIELDIDDKVKGKDVLIVEDIIDTGLTLNFLKGYLFKKGAKKIRIVTLLDKKEKRKINVEIDYVGFKVPNKFVVGYGIDYNEEYRDLEFIGYVE